MKKSEDKDNQIEADEQPEFDEIVSRLLQVPKENIKKPKSKKRKKKIKKRD